MINHTRFLPFLAVFITIVVGVVRILFRLVNGNPLFIDFGAYYYAAEYFLQGQDMYSSLAGINGAANAGWAYPPILILLFLPFTFFPFDIASYIWILATSVVFAISVFVAPTHRSGTEQPLTGLTLLVISILYPPILAGVFNGNISVLLSGLFLFSTIRLLSNREAEGGVLSIIPGITKPYLLPLASVSISSKVALVAAGLGWAVMLIGSVLLTGVEGFRTYVSTLLSDTHSTGPAEGYVPIDQWTVLTLNPWHIFRPYEYIAIGFVIITTIAILLYARRINSPNQIVGLEFWLERWFHLPVPDRITYKLPIPHLHLFLHGAIFGIRRTE